MRYVFMGSPNEVIAPLSALITHAETRGHTLSAIISQAAKPVGRKLTLTDPPVAQFAKANSLPLLQPLNINDPGFLEIFRDLQPDIVITAAYGQLLSTAFLEIPKRATINIHPSLLPVYRGATPVAQALLDGLSCTGVSILFTVRAMDAGNIILQHEFAIAADEAQGALTERLFRASGPLLSTALDCLLDHRFVGTPQDPLAVTKCRKIKKEDGAVVWPSPAQAIYNRFRAYSPWPGTHTNHADRRITITAMEPWPDGASPPNLSPGEFSLVKGLNGLAVGTSTGPLSILRLVAAGGREMAASAYVNGLKAEVERRFQ